MMQSKIKSKDGKNIVYVSLALHPAADSEKGKKTKQLPDTKDMQLFFYFGIWAFTYFKKFNTKIAVLFVCKF